MMERAGYRNNIHTLIFKAERRTGANCKCTVRVPFSGRRNHIFRNVYTKGINSRLFGEFSKQISIAAGNVQYIISISELRLFYNLFFMGSCIMPLRAKVIFPRHLIVYFMRLFCLFPQIHSSEYVVSYLI